MLVTPQLLNSIVITMDDNIHNINNVNWIRSYDSKKGLQERYKPKKKKKRDNLSSQDKDSMDEDNMINNSHEATEQDEPERENDDTGHKIIDIDI